MKNLRLLLFFFLVACERRATVRHYQETAIAPEPPAASAVDAQQPAPALLAWTTPYGWIEKASTGPRLATFGVGDAECTIVSFPGDVGGLEANLKRWLNQLNVQLADAQVSEFAQKPETFISEGGLPVQLFDFAPILPTGATSSILAAVLTVDEQTVFVKLMGAPALLETEKPRFIALCRSLRH